MSFDLDSLQPGVDLSAVDIDAMDKGDTLDALEEALKEEPVAAEEPVEETVEEPAEEDTPAEEPGDEPARNEKGQFEKKIPKFRFDEQVGKERAAREAAEARAAQLERQIAERDAAAKQSADVEAMEASVEQLEKQYSQLLLDGEADQAAAVMKQIRKAERTIVALETESRTAKRTTQILESERVNLTIAQLEAAHPQLNPESEAFDEELVDDVLLKQSSYINKQGMAPSVALSKAVEYVMGRYQSEPAEDPKGLAKAAEERKTAQVKKNIAVAKAQPANLKESGLDSDKVGMTSSLPDITTMTQDEFNALPEKTRARLRGDTL